MARSEIRSRFGRHQHGHVANLGIVTSDGVRQFHATPVIIGMRDAGDSFFLLGPDGDEIAVLVDRCPEGHRILVAGTAGERPLLDLPNY